jgi:hypothetical protein
VSEDDLRANARRQLIGRIERNEQAAAFWRRRGREDLARYCDVVVGNALAMLELHDFREWTEQLRTEEGTE